MRCTFPAAGIFILCLCGVAGGDDERVESSRLVSLEFIIAEFQSGKSLARKFDMVENPAERLAQLEREGRLTSVARLQFTTLERYEGKVHIGQPRSDMMDSTRRNPRGLSNTTFGTTVAATPWIEKDGSVRIQMTAERSRYIPALEKSDSVGNESPPGSTTFSTKGLFRVPPGKSVLLFGSQSAGQENAGETLMVVTAQVAGARQLSASDVVTDNPPMRIFKLRHLSAAAAAQSVDQLLSEDGVRTTVDNRLNSLIVMGPAKMLAAVESMLQALDVEHR
jgi:hypothetical protein